jgi:hypothetical protein
LADQIAEATKHRHAAEMEHLRAEYTTALEELRGRLADETRRLSGRLDTAVYRSKAQFDLEFTTLRAIWTATSNARRWMLDVRPVFRVSPADQTDEERGQAFIARANKFVEATNACRIAIHDNEPFYPPEIFDALQEALRSLGSEVVDCQVYEPRPDHEWYLRARENATAIEAQVDVVAARIRQHLARVVIIE